MASQYALTLDWRSPIPATMAVLTLPRTAPAKFGSPGSINLIVSDTEIARKELVAREIGVSDVFHAGTPGAAAKDSKIQIEGAG
jgi:hypothetical protein